MFGASSFFPFCCGTECGWWWWILFVDGSANIFDFVVMPLEVLSGALVIELIELSSVLLLDDGVGVMIAVVVVVAASIVEGIVVDCDANVDVEDDGIGCEEISAIAPMLFVLALLVDEHVLLFTLELVVVVGLISSSVWSLLRFELVLLSLFKLFILLLSFPFEIVVLMTVVDDLAVIAIEVVVLSTSEVIVTIFFTFVFINFPSLFSYDEIILAYWFSLILAKQFCLDIHHNSVSV